LHSRCRGDSNIADLGKLYGALGKTVYALCDKQEVPSQAAIEAQVAKLFMHEETAIEKLVLNNTTQAALVRFIDTIELPPHLVAKYPNPKTSAVGVVAEFLGWAKGNWGLAEFLSQCHEAEIPEWIRNTCRELRELCQLPEPEEAETEGDAPVLPKPPAEVDAAGADDLV
jgi:putative ATP-dependent endonuclease of the OLD family